MIVRERLQELIEQGATVYSKYDTFNLNPASSKFIITYGAFGNKQSLRTGPFAVELEDLYEHKADAEWDLEFENVEKRIKFVKPKPFNELDKGSIFLYKNHDFEMKLNIYQCKENGGWLDVDYKDEFIYGSTFNEENYTEACRLIKKLFMGEG